MGWLFSAFGWAYVAFQIPGGWLADCIRPRLLMALVCGLWSLATLLQGFAGTFVLLFSLRLLVGMFEAPSYPINNRLATTWFPDRERAGAIGSYTPASLSVWRFFCRSSRWCKKILAGITCLFSPARPAWLGRPCGIGVIAIRLNRDA
jgi:MFS family permease